MPANDQDPVLVDHDGPVTRLLLNRPDRGNALGVEMVAALNTGLPGATRAGNRLLVLRGAGRHFCTVFDLSRFESLSDAILLERFAQVELLCSVCMRRR